MTQAPTGGTVHPMTTTTAAAAPEAVDPTMLAAQLDETLGALEHARTRAITLNVALRHCEEVIADLRAQVAVMREQRDALEAEVTTARTSPAGHTGHADDAATRADDALD